jgi:predicted RNA-binding protein with RPS1 domain
VTRTAEFGAFVELEPGIEGLIHVSELSTQRVRRVRDVISEGQTVEVEVLSVDPAARRIALSLKRLAAEKEAAEERSRAGRAGGRPEGRRGADGQPPGQPEPPRRHRRQAGASSTRNEKVQRRKRRRTPLAALHPSS